MEKFVYPKDNTWRAYKTAEEMLALPAGTIMVYLHKDMGVALYLENAINS